MKINELKLYKVICNIEADVEDINGRPSDAKYELLSDYEEDLKSLFESGKDIDIKMIEEYLKNKGYNIYIEPIKK